MRAPRRCRVSVLRGNLYSCWPLYTGWRLHVHRTAICCLSRMNEFFLRSRGGGGWNWVGVVSGLLNPNDSGVSAQERRPHHGERHHEGGGCRRRRFAFRQLGGDDKAREWRGAALPAYQRRTRAADADRRRLSCRVRRALAAAFSGSVGKDVVSRTWRKVNGDWDACNARSLVDEPVVRLILDGTVARDLGLVAGRARRASGRPESAAHACLVSSPVQFYRYALHGWPAKLV
jgi:hypothetical protein